MIKYIFLILLCSCGIVSTQKEIISISSTPPGIEVFQNNKDLMGKTPFYAEVEKNPGNFYVFRPMKKPIYPMEVCDYNKTVKPNTTNNRSVNDVLNGVNPVDLMDSSKYECVKTVRATLGPPSASCKTIVVVPPKSNYVETSFEIFKKYKKEIFEVHKNSCDIIISPYEAEDYFTFLGIDHLSPPQDLSEMNSSKIFKIGLQFEATHILFLPYERENSKINVKPKLYDIHEGKEETGDLTKPFSIKQEDEDTISNFFLSSFRLIPNGLGLQINTANRLNTTLNGQNGPTFNNHEIKFGITLDNILYPQEKWAINFLAVPVFNFINQEYISITGLTLDFKIFLHLPPGGVLVARGGVGGAFLDSTLSFISDAGLEFYFFPLERVYLGLGYKKYFFPDNTVSYNGFWAKNESYVFLELGYFWPELRVGARGLFD